MNIMKNVENDIEPTDDEIGDVDSVKIKNFKCLKNINTSLRNLTLIAGVNSSGKSSFIQAFLLFKENLSTSTQNLNK